MIPLRNEKKKLHCKQEACHICEKIFSTNDGIKNIKGLKIISILLENIDELIMVFVI